MAFFYHSQIRKYVGTFGKLFSQLHVQRVDDNGDPQQLEIVPLKYSPKDSFVYKANQDPQLDRQPAIKLPHMGFELTSVARDENRSRTSTQRITLQESTDNTGQTFTYVPVPVQLSFDLTIGAKTQTELFQIIEQIIPLFDPDLSLNVTIVETGDSFIVPVFIQSNSLDDTYDQKIGERRAITWTMSFDMYAYVFGPERKSNIIRQVINNFETPNGDFSLTFEPTLNDGTPIDEINPDDPWVVDITSTH